MNTALNLCQWRHDHAEPPSEERFIDTAEGHAWACGVAEDLIDCKGLTISGREVIKPFALADRFGELASAAFDPHGNYNVALLAGAVGDGQRSGACFAEFMGKDFVQNLAYQMAAEHAEDYAKSRIDDDHD